MSRKENLPRATVARQNEYLTAVAGVGALTLGCWVMTPLTVTRRSRSFTCLGSCLPEWS